MKRNPKKPIGYKFSELASRLNGISLPIFGVSWQAPEPERKIVRSVLISLEDRRALYNPFVFEMEHYVTASILEIRQTLTDAIQRLPEKSEAIKPLRVMRMACREYLDAGAAISNSFAWREYGFMAPLGRLRTIYGYQIAQLAIMYGIDVEGELAQILPPEYQQDSALTD